MTWVAAEPEGTPFAGFEYNTLVTWELTDGTPKTGRIIVQGTDKIGSVHKIQDDDDPEGMMIPVPVAFVRRLSD